MKALKPILTESGMRADGCSTAITDIAAGLSIAQSASPSAGSVNRPVFRNLELIGVREFG